MTDDKGDLMDTARYTLYLDAWSRNVSHARVCGEALRPPSNDRSPRTYAALALAVRDSTGDSPHLRSWSEFKTGLRNLDLDQAT